MKRFILTELFLLISVCWNTALAQEPNPASTGKDSQTRTVNDPQELKFWLENMAWHHKFSKAEMAQVTGLSAAEIDQRLIQWKISDATQPARPKNKLFVLPYPGGRHPRSGFLEGAVDPQRETKLSAFCPWDDHSYAVLDVPEAVWSNLGLTYLAHTHIDTIWSRDNIKLAQQEWDRQASGNYELVRRLPNGIELGVKVIPMSDHLRMKMWLTNGTKAPLTDLRVQNCVMLKGAAGFTQQANDNKRYVDGYAVAKATHANRWVITAWDPLHRNWANERCPCLHSDPKFPDCAPGETVWLRGWFSFYEGDSIDQELKRIEATHWRTHPLHHVTGNVVGTVIDADSKKVIPSRLYAESIDDKTVHFARSTAVAGSAITYDKRRGNRGSIEQHTTLSADGFQLDVPPGQYRLRAEHGKEYMPYQTIVTVGDERVRIKMPLKRFVDLNAAGWFSGDTHVHRKMEELPNVMMAEDLNVALPLNYWVRDSRKMPTESIYDGDASLVKVDATHVIYPINTEYEIFTIDGKPHTQGAVFILNHTTPFQLSSPPTKAIADEARRQDAILDLDKHSWNWSMMIVPVMDVDLFELSNNHHWRTNFGFPSWTVNNAPPNWPQIERDESGFTELGWTQFGMQTYYGLLNCGFRMRVSAGTASGVHPVPLGHGRVYVHVGDKFDYETWIQNLNAGHSFVTQGPLMDLRFNSQLPGKTWNFAANDREQTTRISGTIDSQHPLKSIEVVVNGEVKLAMTPTPLKTSSGSYRYKVDTSYSTTGSAWIAVRCFEDLANGKVSFAHTNPVFLDVADEPVRPRRRVLQYFIMRMDSEIQRNRDVLSDAAIDEFRKAKSIYESMLPTAR